MGTAEKKREDSHLKRKRPLTGCSVKKPDGVTVPKRPAVEAVWKRGQGHSSQGMDSAKSVPAPQVRDLSLLNDEQRSEVLEEVAHASVIVLTMVYQDGSSQLTAVKSTQPFATPFIHKSWDLALTMDGPGQIVGDSYSLELECLDHFHLSTIDTDRGMSSSPLPEFDDQLLCFAVIDEEIEPTSLVSGFLMLLIHQSDDSYCLASPKSQPAENILHRSGTGSRYFHLKLEQNPSWFQQAQSYREFT
eukprot:g45420.t1